MQEIACGVHLLMDAVRYIDPLVSERVILVLHLKANVENRLSLTMCVCVCAYFILIRNDERGTDKVFAAAVECSIFNNI